MGHSVLGSVTLGYEPLWNPARKRCGIRLWVDTEDSAFVDSHHLLSAIAELWPKNPSALILSVRSAPLLNNLLEQAPAQSIWIEIQESLLQDAIFAGRVRKAAQRGLQMVWRGEPGQAPSAQAAGWFYKTIRSLTPHQALDALRVSLRQSQDGGAGPNIAGKSPVLAGSIYESLASQALVEHALDRQGAWAVAGWPGEEVLHGYRYRQIQVSRDYITALVQAIDADESLEGIEHRMGDEPLLNYRFLRYANSAGLSVRNEISSVRQGLLTLGLARLRAWLLEQLTHSSSDPNLQPIRASMVLRARIMERLADAGVEDDLRREVFLCGIFSQVDLLLGEALGASIHRLPLPGRVASAILGQTGPYAPWLEVAEALESGSTRVIREVCKAHDIATEDVNRALLRALATA